MGDFGDGRLLQVRRSSCRCGKQLTITSCLHVCCIAASVLASHPHLPHFPTHIPHDFPPPSPQTGSTNDPLWSAACDPTAPQYGMTPLAVLPNGTGIKKITPSMYDSQQAELWPWLVHVSLVSGAGCSRGTEGVCSVWGGDQGDVNSSSVPPL